MLFLMMLTGVALVILGAIVGRAYERNVWQQRVLARLRVLEGDSHVPFAIERVAPHNVALESKPVDPAIEAMALEIERIGEGQRFLTKLLTERPHSPVARARSPIPGSVRSALPPTVT